ncbi:hypothetical protein H5399_09065 [Tessaracoccus sp. MC1627]|uniref:hypothetical protein n=1 Tax=Tessaracoccus sp. MC1627 TaxID=2760312 RepID=UPI001601A922|nr:hypothetical protein [Tessaracoccus sp. MC1627]MBB1512752.1 hypothetical protein [Tessaracoccus sp. MC1627]
MTVYGITGHQKAPDETWALLSMRLGELLSGPAPVTGVSSLAVGADQRFAQAVLSQGGELHVVLPSKNYRSSMETDVDRDRFQQLLAAATTVEQLNYRQPSEEAYLAAGRRVVDLCDMLVAVWDGLPAQGKGGTADVVEYAREVGKPVELVWPAGLSR